MQPTTGQVNTPEQTAQTNEVVEQTLNTIAEKMDVKVEAKKGEIIAILSSSNLPGAEMRAIEKKGRIAFQSNKEMRKLGAVTDMGPLIQRCLKEIAGFKKEHAGKTVEHKHHHHKGRHKH